MTYKRPRQVRSSSSEDSKSDCDDEELAAFFSITNLRRFSTLERKRLRNLKLNYEMLISMGLLVEKPDFMKPKKKRMCQENKEIQWKGDDSNASDPEWTPSMDWVEVSRRNGKAKPAVKRVTKEKVAKHRVVVGSSDDMTFPGDITIRQEDSSPPKTRPSTKLRRFIPAEEEFYCQDCGLDYLDECPFHGPLTIVRDAKASAGGREHAWHTLPAGLTVHPSKIPGAGLGVWTNELIRNRTRFGPYEGEMITDWDRAEASGYCWKIGKGDLFVDAKNQETSNWLRYVNCCRDRSEQNLIAYQYRGQIYYRTIVDVPPNTELLVWYGGDYGRELGIRPEQMDSGFLYPHKRNRRRSCSSTPLSRGSLQKLDTKNWTKNRSPGLRKAVYKDMKSVRKLEDERDVQKQNDGDTYRDVSCPKNSPGLDTGHSAVDSVGNSPGSVKKKGHSFQVDDSNSFEGVQMSSLTPEHLMMTHGDKPEICSDSAQFYPSRDLKEKCQINPDHWVMTIGSKPESCKDDINFQICHPDHVKEETQVLNLSPEHLLNPLGDKPKSCKDSTNLESDHSDHLKHSPSRSSMTQDCVSLGSGKKQPATRGSPLSPVSEFSVKQQSLQRSKSCQECSRLRCDREERFREVTKVSSFFAKPLKRALIFEPESGKDGCSSHGDNQKQLTSKPPRLSLSAEHLEGTRERKEESCKEGPNCLGDHLKQAKHQSPQIHFESDSGKEVYCGGLTKKPHGLSLLAENSHKTHSRKKDSCTELTKKPEISPMSTENYIQTRSRKKASNAHKYTLTESLRWMQRNICVPCVVLLESLKVKAISASGKPKVDCSSEKHSHQTTAESRATDVQVPEGEVTSKMGEATSKMYEVTSKIDESNSSYQTTAENRATDVQMPAGEVTSKVVMSKMGGMTSMTDEVTSKMVMRGQNIHAETCLGENPTTDRGVQGKLFQSKNWLGEVDWSIRSSGRFTKTRDSIIKQNEVYEEDNVFSQQSIQTTDGNRCHVTHSSNEDEPKCSEQTTFVVESDRDDYAKGQAEKEELHKELQTSDEVLQFNDNNVKSGITRTQDGEDSFVGTVTSSSRELDCERETHFDGDGISSDNTGDFSQKCGGNSCHLGGLFCSEDTHMWAMYASLNVDCGLEMYCDNNGCYNRETSEVWKKKRCRETGPKSIKVRKDSELSRTALATGFGEDCSKLQICDCEGTCRRFGTELLRSCYPKHCHVDHSVEGENESSEDLSQGHNLKELWETYCELNTDMQANLDNLLRELFY